MSSVPFRDVLVALRFLVSAGSERIWDRLRYQTASVMDTLISNCVTTWLLMRKDVGMRLRVEKELRERFMAACTRNNTTAAAVLRAFMEQYAETEMGPMQGDLFGAPTNRTPKAHGPLPVGETLLERRATRNG